MAYTVTMRETATGLERTWTDDWEFILSWWRDGNAECDCNRRWFFQDAAGEQRDDDPPCGDERYRVVGVWAEDGTLLWEGDSYE